jgi:hypothetical protein
MRLIALAAIAAVSSYSIILHSAHADTINGLYSTGVDSSNNLLPGGTQDPHYLVDSGNPTYVLSAPNLWPTWPEPTTGEWINYVDSSQTGGTHTFTLSFNLTGFDPSSAVIQLTWTGDNATTVDLNGNFEASIDTNGFSTLHNTTINSGFVSGLNVLSFTVSMDTFDGLLVSSINGTATPAVGVPGPLAGAGLPGLMLAGAGLLGWWRRRKKEGAAAFAAA